MVDPSVKVFVGIPTGEYARRADFYDYVNMLRKPANTIQMFCHERSPAKARNLIIEQAFEHNCSHVLFIDDDMAFKPDALEQLLSHNVDIVSGLYYKGDYPHQSLIFDYLDENGRALFFYLNGNEPRLMKIEAAGLGFCLFKTSVFKKLEKPYVRLGELDPEQWCDDIGLFWRIKQAGIKVYCDMECRLGHIKSMIIWPTKVDGKWHTGYDTGAKGMISTPQILPETLVTKV